MFYVFVVVDLFVLSISIGGVLNIVVSIDGFLNYVVVIIMGGVVVYFFF